MTPSPQGQWVILRTSGQNTLRLADSLNAAGIEAWTPRETREKRKGKSRARYADSNPVMPSYVFSRATHLIELLEASQAFASPHPAFTVFRHLARFPVVDDETLDPLRLVERKRQPKGSLPRFTKGELVQIFDGGFAGLTGVVELTKGQFTLVTFPGFPMPLKISTLLLERDIPQHMRKAA